MSSPLRGALLLLAALVLYLLLWPTGMSPVAWTAPPAPLLAPNEKLKAIQRLGEAIGAGPEGIYVDATGHLYAGLNDGRVVLISLATNSWIEIANTGGRPLGITFNPGGDLVVADSDKGLLQLGRKEKRAVTEAGGVAIGYANGATGESRGRRVYVTDSSSKFGRGQYARDLLEHGANGRLLEYDTGTHQARVLLKDLHFPNGVALGPDGAYVLVSETAEYRILRYWLKGEKAGTQEVFVDNLPGFPDNLSFNGRDRFWLALAGSRSPVFDELLRGNFFLRQVLGRLPAALYSQGRRAFVLGFDLDGKVVANLQYAGRDAYAPVTSVCESGPWLYFGSRSARGIGRIPLDLAVAGVAAPPPGWERVPLLAERRQNPAWEED